MSTRERSYFDRVQRLRTGRAGDRIPYSPELLEVFRRYFDEVRTANDQPNAHLPYWHLRGDRFFHHAPVDGQEDTYAVVSSVKGSGELGRLVQYAYLDDELFALLSDEASRRQFRDTIIDRYFRSHRDEILAISGDDLLWHVSNMLDDRIEGQRDLIVLRNRSVLVPANQRYHPRQDALRWRQERLRK